MKKLLCLMTACALCAIALAGCSRSSAPGGDTQPDTTQAVDFEPQTTAVPQGHGEEDQSLLIGDPTAPPAERLVQEDASQDGDYFSMDALSQGDGDAVENPKLAEIPIAQDIPGAIDPSTYQFSALIDTSLGFTFNYPAHWENLPGVYTVCFREVAEAGKFPARVAVTAKKLTHTPEGTVLRDELGSYMRTIYRQYDSSTFQTGTANTEDTFLGREAMSNTYLAYSGETEVKGFVIGCSVGKVVYVFHFCASYEDYQALENIMRYMLRSVQLVED